MKRITIIILAICLLAPVFTWGQVTITPSRAFAPFLKLGQTTPSTTTDTLYNPGGVLTYNGAAVILSGGTASSATLWGAYASITGPSQARTFTFPDAAATLLYDGKASGTFGIASSATGSLIFKNISNTNAFTLQPGATGAALSWTLPIAAPGGNNYLLNAQTTGVLSYTDPAIFALVGQTMSIGTTAVAINRASAALVLTGITSIDGTAAKVTSVTTSQKNALGAAATGTHVYDSTLGIYQIFNGTSWMDGKGVTSTLGIMPNPSLEVNTSGWVADGGGAPIARGVVNPKFGTAYVRCTPGSQWGGVAAPSLNLNINTSYLVTFWIRGTLTAVTPNFITDNSGNHYGDTITPTGTWTQYTLPFTTNGADASGHMRWYTSDAVPGANYFDIDGVLIEVDGGAASTYRDGYSGSIVLTAGVTTVVNNPEIKATSKILLQETDGAGPLLVPYISSVAAGTFTITHANAAGTEGYSYLIM
ncbi:hypothetical protein D4S03_11950 [bacterium]|nr:MAG: hypothetical protein D4S03_11950 [bacterium]